LLRWRKCSITAQIKHAKLNPATRTIAFCNTAHWAATDWFVLNELADFGERALYDGSMAEWSQDNNRPLKVALFVVGSFLFGIGMQLGGGCSAGNTRMVVTSVFFIAGSVLGSIHLPWWLDQPGFEPVPLVDTFGVSSAIVIRLAALGLVAWWVNRIERKTQGNVERRRGLLCKGQHYGVLRTLISGNHPG